MTSPAINNGNNGQKESSKTGSSATLAGQRANQSAEDRTGAAHNLSPLTAWWRVFKMCNLLTMQKC